MREELMKRHMHDIALYTTGCLVICVHTNGNGPLVCLHISIRRSRLVQFPCNDVRLCNSPSVC